MTQQPVRNITGTETRISVSRTVFGQETEDTEHIEIRPFATTPARVRVELGRTINLGNYESARINIAMEIPCYREEAISIYPALFNHVAERMNQEVSKISGATIEGDVSIEEVL